MGKGFRPAAKDRHYDYIEPYQIVDFDWYLCRAKAAWYRRCSKTREAPDDPVNYLSGVVTLANGRMYVVLQTEIRLLAVYRLKPNGELHQLESPPKGIEAMILTLDTSTGKKYRYDTSHKPHRGVSPPRKKTWESE